MGLSFIDKKSWQDITREERFFCSHLYHSIINRKREFVEWLINNTTLKLNPNKHWEIGYEVCFYRDLIHHWKKLGKAIPNENQYSPKRTFDLCLFSNDHIVIIEAKAHGKFDGTQRKDAIEKKDIKDIKKLLGSIGYNVEVDLILLHSSKYHPRNDLIKITWEEVNSKFPSKHFERANSIYND